MTTGNIPAYISIWQTTNLLHELLCRYYSWAGSQHVPHCNDQTLLIGYLIQHLYATPASEREHYL